MKQEFEWKRPGEEMPKKDVACIVVTSQGYRRIDKYSAKKQRFSGFGIMYGRGETIVAWAMIPPCNIDEG